MSRLSTVDGILALGNRRQGFRPIAIANLAFVASIALGALALASDEFEIDDSKRLLTESGDGTLRPGDLVRDAAFRDIDGKEHWLYASLERGPAVLVFLSTSCPMAARYSKRLEQLDAQLVERGATVYGIFSGSGETLESVREHRERASFRFPIIHDRDARLARHVDATMTPQAFVIDKSRRLRYRGAIDDNRIEDRVKARYLEDALRSVLAGEKVALETTRSAGCSIHFPDPPAPKDVTYTRHIAPILADRCEGCHRAGQVAPFALSSYEDAKRWSTEIRAYTEKRLMPPWKPARGFGDLIDHTSLSDEEIELIAKWVDAGTPEGDSKDLPPRPRFTDGWAYGEPDLVLEMPEEYIVGPEGEDDYRHFIIPIELDDDRYVQAVDVRPGNARTVHHVIAYVDTSGRARELDAKDPGPGYTRFGGTGFDPVSTLGGWAPGFTPQRTPEGSGAWLPKRADVVLQVHYYRTGFEERDRTRVGLWFAKDEKPVKVRGAMAINTEFRIPAGEESYEVRATTRLREDAYVYSVTPHMHLLGRGMEVVARLPLAAGASLSEETIVPLILIEDWDFAWQRAYPLRDLLFLPRGTTIELRAWFDNSAKNPNNPNDPPRPVRFGERTTDEMAICFLSYLRASEYDPDARGRRVE